MRRVAISMASSSPYNVTLPFTRVSFLFLDLSWIVSNARTGRLYDWYQ
jgi:hypothetical protein